MDWKAITTPIKTQELREELERSEYEPKKLEFLIKGFEDGFDLGYRGPENRQDLSKNIPFTVGNPTEMWNKIMKEVKERHFPRPFKFEDLPFENYMQSPISLVPKAGNKTHLIFHLSYDFGSQEHQKLFNYFTPDELCSVKYNDLEFAIARCLKMIKKMKEQGGVFSQMFFCKK